MGTKQSSLARKSTSNKSREVTTETLQNDLTGERGLIVNEINANTNKIIKESLEVLNETESEYESSDDDSDDESKFLVLQWTL